MNFKRFFDIQIEHDYYAGKVCRDLALVPTQETKAMCRNTRLLLREKPNGIFLIIPVNENGDPSIDLSEDMLFRFFVQIRRPEVLSFTEFDKEQLTKILGRGYAHFYFKNQKDVLEEQAPFQYKTTDYFKLTQFEPNASFHLQGRPVPNIVRDDFEIDNLFPNQKIITYIESEKRVTIKTDKVNREIKHFTLTYPAIPNWPAQTLAVIDIEKPDSFSLNTTFKLSFQAKKSEWKYYFPAQSEYTKLKIVEVPQEEKRTEEEANQGNNQPRKEYPAVNMEENDDHAKAIKALFPAVSAHYVIQMEERTHAKDYDFCLNLQNGSTTLRSFLPFPAPADNGIVIIHLNHQ